jgi:hypothetical protein
MTQEQIFAKQEEIQSDFHNKMDSMYKKDNTLTYYAIHHAILYEYLAKISLELDELKNKNNSMYNQLQQETI